MASLGHWVIVSCYYISISSNLFLNLYYNITQNHVFVKRFFQLFCASCAQNSSSSGFTPVLCHRLTRPNWSLAQIAILVLSFSEFAFRQRSIAVMLIFCSMLIFFIPIIYHRITPLSSGFFNFFAPLLLLRLVLNKRCLFKAAIYELAPATFA